MTSSQIDRLRDGRDVVAVLRSRRQRAGRHVVAYAGTERRDGPPRVAVVASRRVGSAVARNRAKRLLREAARSVAWAAGSDVVLVARGGCAEQRLPAVSDEVARLAAELGVAQEQPA